METENREILAKLRRLGALPEVAGNEAIAAAISDCAEAVLVPSLGPAATNRLWDALEDAGLMGADSLMQDWVDISAPMTARANALAAAETPPE